MKERIEKIFSQMINKVKSAFAGEENKRYE